MSPADLDYPAASAAPFTAAFFEMRLNLLFSPRLVALRAPLSIAGLFVFLDLTGWHGAVAAIAPTRQGFST